MWRDYYHELFNSGKHRQNGSTFSGDSYSYTIILLMDTGSLSLTSVCGAYFWSLQTEFWADRFIRFWHFSSAAFIEKIAERVSMLVLVMMSSTVCK